MFTVGDTTMLAVLSPVLQTGVPAQPLAVSVTELPGQIVDVLAAIVGAAVDVVVMVIVFDRPLAQLVPTRQTA